MIISAKIGWIEPQVWLYLTVHRSYYIGGSRQFVVCILAVLTFCGCLDLVHDIDAFALSEQYRLNSFFSVYKPSHVKVNRLEGSLFYGDLRTLDSFI